MPTPIKTQAAFRLDKCWTRANLWHLLNGSTRVASFNSEADALEALAAAPAKHAADMEATARYAEKCKARLDAGRFKSADEYQQTKDAYWNARARLAGTTYARINPMGFWFGGQSA